MGGAAISSKELSVGYGKKVVVSGLGFEVRAGEILTIIGPNGAGKSTILKTIAAQLPAIAGSVSINDTDISLLSSHEAAQTLSVCLTERITAEKMTCADVVSTGRYPYTGLLGILSDSDRKIVREAMELTGISHLADTDIIVSTLWAHIEPYNAYLTERNVSDFYRIKYEGHRLNAQNFNAEHERCLAFIKQSVTESKAKTKIVLTHHVPTQLCTVDEFKGSTIIWLLLCLNRFLF